MRTLTYYYSGRMPESNQLQNQVLDLAQKNEIGCLFIDVDTNSELQSRFAKGLPVVLIGPYQLQFPFTITEVEVAILSTLDKDKHTGNNRSSLALQIPRLTRLETFSLWFSNHYPWVITVFLLLYSAIPFLAPVLERNGNSSVANLIYKTYSILCHQLAFRSYFIGGEQPFYPRDLAGIDNYLSYEDVTGYDAEDIITARNFLGNDSLGFKVALCERDIAIYSSMAIVGIIFALRKKNIKKIPWYIWFIVAILPIGFDGISQLPGLSENWPSWMPNRESTPLLRTITGILFGGGTAWFMYPLIEETVKETRFQLVRKLQVVQYLDKGNDESNRIRR